ncbi:hypothetical protein EV652_107360 [Kribbella steppae]|uniref:Lipoprotein LpqN n=1 Tax=Kribbella steppae TaxID=2512223 RepID=A0A4V2RZJ3_9ACTN|nr:hypothetical protein [Kribbella steppae]TCO26468.1 hypothetical protein EV652_107360 [Kribbella steppae]
MKRRAVLAAAIGAGGLLLAGILPSMASTTTSQQSSGHTVAASTQSGQDHLRPAQLRLLRPGRLPASAELPKTWRHVALGIGKARFLDPARNRMVRFDLTTGGKVSTATALRKKQAALKGTRGLKVVGTSTVVMKSTSGQGRLTVSTIVYTYRSGNTTRWVATRYIGFWGNKTANIEITVAGTTKDRKDLGAVINRATQSIYLAG